MLGVPPEVELPRIGSEESLTLPHPVPRLGVLFYEDFGL